MAHTTARPLVTDHSFTPWKTVATRCNTCGKVEARHQAPKPRSMPWRSNQARIDNRRRAEVAALASQLEATVKVYECEHGGDTDNAAQALAQVGIRTISAKDPYMLGSDEEVGYLVVRYQGTAEALRAAIAKSDIAGLAVVVSSKVVA